MPSPAGSSLPPIVVVGGGISGLVCAHELWKRGQPVRLLEVSEHWGGVIRTERLGDCLVEQGPQSFQPSERLERLIEEVGLGSELLHADARAPRYVWYRGRLRAAPLGLGALVGTSLLSWRGKLRLLKEPFVPRRMATEEPAAAFFRRRFGAELTERLVEPFLSGVYAGDAERLSLPGVFPELARWEVEYGSVLKGAIRSRKRSPGPRRTLCSFRGGLERLPQAMVARLGEAAWSRTRALSIEPATGGARYRLEIERNGQRESLAAASVVLATAAWEAARLAGGLSARLAARLEGLTYAPLAVVWARYRREQVPRFPGGFGFLVPRSEGEMVLGTVFSSALFPGRAPADSYCFTSFVGGVNHPEALQRTDAELGQVVSQLLQHALGTQGNAAVLGVQRYGRSIPQYNLGFLDWRKELEAEAARCEGLYLTGNYLGGVAIANCVEHAAATAARLAAN